MKLSRDQVKQYLYNAGFRGNDLNNALLIAECESSLDTHAHNLSNIEDSRGLMQINIFPNANPQYSGYDLFDPVVNTQVAYQIYKAWGNNFNAWSCWDIINKNDYTIPVIALMVGFFIYLSS